MATMLAEVAQKKRTWGDRSLLRGLSNPSRQRYEAHVYCPEVTFLGRRAQPDFACVNVTMYPGEKVIELKSLKRYLFSFREVLMSYERFVNVLYEDLIETYEPQRLIVEIHLRPRGGIHSRLKIDSDWRSTKTGSGLQ